MSVDITIRQKGLIKKALPLEVILGKELAYGAYDGALRLTEAGPDDLEIIAYRPDCFGRGISVTWNPKEKRGVMLRALSPTSEIELKDFYEMIGRICSFWSCSLEVDGAKTEPEAFLSGLDDMIEFNRRSVMQMAQRILEREDGCLTFFSARWPLNAGHDEAKRFLKNPDSFGQWLNERQAMDVYYAAPGFFMTEDGIVGRYALTEGVDSVFPRKPEVPFGMVDSQTGRSMECSTFEVALCMQDGEEPVGFIAYDELLSRIPPEKISSYDGACVLIGGLTREELAGLIRI